MKPADSPRTSNTGGVTGVNATSGAGKGGTGVLDNANYAQKTYSNTFSARGKEIYSDLAGELPV